MTQPPSPTVPVRLSIGVAGHRDLRAEQEPALRVQVRALFERLRAEIPDLPLRVVSALAEGGDQLVAEEALALGIPVLAPLPLAQAEYERDFADPQALARFRDLLERCQARPLPPLPGAEAEAIARPGPERERHYAQAGVFVSSHCQILLALWDGKPSEAMGGTAEVVSFHLNERMPALGWSAPTPNQLAEDANDLVYHLPCERQRTGAPTEASVRLEPRWLTAEDARPGAGPMPDEYRRTFEHMQSYNRDLRRHAGAIARQSSGILPAASDRQRDTRLMHRLDALYRQTDWLAMHYQRQVRRGLIATHLLAVAMGLAFIAYDNVSAERWLLLAFVLCFGFGWLWYRIGRRRDWHRKYLDYRALAEGLRVQLYWHLAGVRASGEILFAYDSFLQKQDVELGWVRHVMRGASLLHDRRRAPGPEWLGWTIADWVGDDGAGQLGYFRRQGARCQAHYRHTQRLGAAALAGGLAVAALLLILHGRLPAAAASYLLVLVGLLPLMAGVREAYSHKKADKELIKQYRFMAGIFARARKRLDAAENDAQRRGILKAIGEAALQEHAEWLLMHRERPLEHSQMG